MSFTPATDIPDLSEKVILVTGGNSGLGRESILQLAKHNPRQLIMASRSQEKAEAAIREIEAVVPGAKIAFLSVDLASFDSIQKAAQSVTQEYDRLDVLLNNAGMMGAPPGLTQDGYEAHFGSNHMGPALLTKLLLPLMEKTSQAPNSDVRIVQVSSGGYEWSPAGGFLFEQLKTPMESVSARVRYGQSKLANIYFSKTLAKRYPTIKCVSLHPGVVNTGIIVHTRNSYWYFAWVINLIVRLFFTDVSKGALGQLWAAVGKSEELKSGTYYEPLKKEVTNKVLEDEELANKLWDWQEKEFAGYEKGMVSS